MDAKEFEKFKQENVAKITEGLNGLTSMLAGSSEQLKEMFKGMDAVNLAQAMKDTNVHAKVEELKRNLKNMNKGF